MKTNSLENAWLLHYFNNSAIANVGDATGLPAAATVGSLHLSAHTAFPGEAGAQNTSECAYTGYARQAVARSGAGFTVSTNSVTNAATVAFGQKTAGADETIFYVGIGRSASGVGTLDYICPCASDRAPFTATAADNITVPGVSFAVNDRVAFFDVFEGDFPAGLTAGTVYWVVSVTGDVITVSTTQGGGAVDITSVGSGVAFKMAGLAVSNGVNPQIAASAMSLLEY